MKKKTIFLLTIVAVAVTIACRKELPSEEVSSRLSEPVLPEQTEDFPVSLNDELATLGKVLFYDRNLSQNNSVSCASCHQQNKAFCDNLATSPGLEGNKTGRNTPAIISKSGRLFWDGRASGINDLVLRPVKDHVEMGVKDLGALPEKLASLSYYPELFQKAFATSYIDTGRIKEALVEFLKNFEFTNNRFKRHLMQNEQLTANEKLGKDLFFGKALCSNCHNIQQATFPMPGGGGIGYGDSSPVPIGRNIGLDESTNDRGIAAVTNLPADEGRFVMPVLFNVEYTHPYMHDARFKTLEEVVEHYNSGIKNHPNLDPVLRDISKFENMDPEEAMKLLDTNHDGFLSDDELRQLPPVRLNLTAGEKKQLVAFLKTLSDPAIKTDLRFSDPFVSR